jgi:simple sugar transport system ATP-binding protein
MVRGMCTRGELSALIITHKFREVQSYCDEVTVLRHGKLTGEGRVADLTPAAMAQMMMGTAVMPEQAARELSPLTAAPRPRLILDNLTALNEIGVPALQGLSLEVKPHEIVGIAGVSGNGQRELVQVLAGQRKASGGRVIVQGAPYTASRDEMRRHRFHVLPEMPLQNACVPTMTTAENLAFRRFDSPAMTLARCFVNLRAVKTRACELIERFRIRPTTPTARIGNLSGGNVQRAVLARELAEEVEVLIAANPCFGLDFKAVAEIRSRIMQARNRGAAVLLVSEDLDEILELADRILVISAGKIVHETPVQAAERHVIGRYMAGH